MVVLIQMALLAILAFCLCGKRLRFKLPKRGDSSDRTQRKESPGDCARIPPKVYRRPDPLIYSQQYLKAQGLAVTWNNPDIQLELNGVPVDSSSLDPDTTYTVVARVWNGSVDAPAIDLPVRAHFLDFGIGGARVDIGEDRIDLPVKGAAGHPAFARIPWTTPAAPGHYCLRIELIWPDDANPANNVGQENTNVKPLNSPHAAFDIEVRNDDDRRRAFALVADDYEIRTEPCDDEPRGRTPYLDPSERRFHTVRARTRHGSDRFGIPPGWTVVLDPEELVLGPGEVGNVTVDITAPDDFVGKKAFNVTALEGQSVFSGVTLYVHS